MRVWGGVALVLALVIAIPLVLMNPRTPERAAREYLDALVAGDAGVLKEHLAATPDASPVGLVDAVLQGAQRRVTGYDLEGVSISGDTATVTSTVTWSDGAKPGTLALAAHAEGAGPLLARSWVLDPVALQSVSVGVPLGADHLEIGGVEVPLPEDAEQARSDAAAAVPDGAAPEAVALLSGTGVVATLQLPAGSYDLAAASRNGLVRGVPETLRADLPGARTPSRSPVMLTMELTADGEEAATQEATDLITQCARSTTAAPEGCPFAATGSDASEPGTWEILTAPPGLLTTFDGVDSWLVGATDAGEARFTPDATGSPAQTVRFLPSVRMVLTPGGELTASVDAEAAICVDA
ncbi:hypothetical protein C1N80_03930 [Brachybacterium sp. SGAir0954]|nr:hypothetical protein C1N80_03930 [Brachybacterium sp. SGAir0954]